MANGQRDVTLAIRAKDETQRALNSAKNALTQFVTASQRAARYRGLLENQRETAAEAKRLALELKNAGLAASGDQVRGFNAARAAAKRATDQLEAYRRELRGVNSTPSAGGGFRTFDQRASFGANIRENVAASQAARAASGFRQFEAALQASQLQADALAAELDQVAAAQQRAAVANNTATASANRNAAAMRNQGAAGDFASRVAGAYATRRGRGPLGLRPYELQNLGFQINDLVTQIASGTSPTQALAQQGGQLIQIFPRAASAIVRLVPVLGLVTAAVAPFIAAFARVNEVNANVRRFSATLASSADGARYGATELAGIAREIDSIGFSADQARSAVETFRVRGLNPAFFDDFAASARNLSRITGQDLTEATNRVARAFSAGYDEVKALDDGLNFLTLAERRQIRELYESGRASEARTLAFRIFQREMSEGADQMNGPWRQAVNNLGQAWDNFVNYLSNTSIIRSTIELLGRLARRVRQLTSLLPGASRAAGIASDVARREELDRMIRDTGDRISSAPVTSSFGGPSRRELENQLDRLVRERFEVGARISAVQNEARREADGILLTGTEAEAKREEDALLERRARGSSDAADDAARLAESQSEFLESLRAENEERIFQASIAGETERQQKILTELREAEIEAQRVGLELTAEQRQAIIDSVNAREDALLAEQAFQRINEVNLQLAEARGEVETRDAFVRRNLAEENLSIESALGSVRADQLGQLYDINEAARQRAQAEQRVNDLTATQAELLEQIEFLDDSGQTAAADALRQQLEGVNAQLLEAINNSIALFREMGGPNAELAILRLEGMKDRLEAFNLSLVASGRQINESIAQGATSAFDRFAQAVADGGNALTSLRDAFLQFAADFLREIAQMILQQAILNALFSAGGGGGSIGGAIAGAINAIFRHQGGTTSGGGRRTVPLSAFANAARYHTGGIAGFAPNEVPAVLTRGEEVLTEDDPRHRANGGMMGGGAVNVKNVNLFNPVDLLRHALADEEGQKVIVNFMGDNSRKIQGALAR